MAMFYTRDIPYGSAQTELQQVTENQALSRDWAPRTAQWTAKLSILTSSNSHYLLTHVLGSYVEQSMNGYSVWLCRNMQQHQKKKWFAVHFSYALKKQHNVYPLILSQEQITLIFFCILPPPLCDFIHI